MPVLDPFGHKVPSRKRIIICCDGTWQSSDGGEPSVPTNVTRITRALKSYTKKDGISQIVYYQSGVGTGGTLNKILGGGTGYGLDEHVREAYCFLSHNYHPGDSIHLFGFSRGAYTARSVCGLICTVGVLTKKGMDEFHDVWSNYTKRRYKEDPGLLKELQDREDGKLVISGVKVKSIGCWDTVGSLGIPSIRVPFFGELSIARGENKTSFHNVELSDEVENAFHALALDEHRGPFTPTLWKKSPFSPTNLKQVWFPGVHTNIGGGYDDQEIADITLAWMIQQHLPFLEFSKGYLKSIIKNHEDYTREWAAGLIYDSATGMMRVFSGSYRTPGGYADSTEGVEMEEFIHKSVRIRTKMIEGWECRALKGWVWKEDEGLWEKDGKKLLEDTLGNVEKKLAGKHVVKNMLGEVMPKDVEW
ncbi:hypothetical protein P167DRAFT_487458 [Morchella conica CCBAS932]|uniref:T6SS Phospholipase effector Tle1-like catalytic domain-containing protein n=1 Tax=Morchella conica CCBAS932 TaxID=1392247 RepID=A0A3N4KTE7_9PEZI|nr:hypothetical protein P167DRAFT_487458 [Morchella conica CCBAS932]